MKKEKFILVMLRVCAFLIFFGRAYHYLYFNPPFRNILWDQELLSPIVEGWFQTPWSTYVSSSVVDQWIQYSIQINGLLFLIAAIACLFINKKNMRWLRIPIYLGSACLVFLAFLATRETFHHYGQFFEHTIQIFVPVLLVIYLSERLSIKKIVVCLKLMIAATFVSHGLYALGYYPIPGHFINMTITSLNVSETLARQILWVAGVLDILLSIVIFIPRIAKYALYYACFWGLVTAMARMVAPFHIDFIATSLHQTWYQTLYRLPHGLIPLLAAVVHIRMQRKKSITYIKPNLSQISHSS